MPSLSIIIPAWNEAPLIADAVRCARTIGDAVIVADGGSSDGTADTARTTDATVLQAPKGRGLQLRAGAAAAKGDVLLILHADARLPPLAREPVLGALADPEVIGGNFLNRFLPESWFTRILEPVNDRRRRRTRRYYGDSGIFVRRAVHDRLGGFDPYPIMHDYAFLAKMERAGRCVYVREPCLYASARRFQGREVRTALTWLAIQSLFPRGVSPTCWRAPTRTCAVATPSASWRSAGNGSPRRDGPAGWLLKRAAADEEMTMTADMDVEQRGDAHTVTPSQLSRELREADDPDLRRRRWIVGLSLAGTAAAQAVSLYQMGILRRLPDLPSPYFDATRVDASDYAYKRMRTPDGLLMLASYAATAILAGVGGKDRARDTPALPIALAAKTLYDSAIALKLAREEWDGNKALCGYCQSATVASLASAVLALP